MLPKKITLVEVGPRDGFQNVKEQIATEDKIAIIKGMIQAGVRQMEITSFVNPKWLPQMADAADVVTEILKTAPAHFRAIALAPNKRGVENAVKAGLKNVTYVVSASESHNQKNVNRPIEKSLEELKSIKEDFADTDIRVSLATSFGCPFEGEVPLENVLSVLGRLHEVGIREVVLCDTIGVGNPLQVQQTVQAVKQQFSDLILGLHFHDTRGMGLSNIYAGLSEGTPLPPKSGHCWSDEYALWSQALRPSPIPCQWHRAPQDVKETPIHQAYIGSCTGGRYNDLEAAAKLLQGKRIAKGLRLLVSPASDEIWRRADKAGILSTLAEAGATVLAPTCGVCVGLHSGMIAAGENCISSSNRNFIGRMGSKKAGIYLGSPLTVAASALTGHITDPREVM